MKRAITMLSLVGMLALAGTTFAGSAGAATKGAPHGIRGVAGNTIKIDFFTYRPDLFTAAPGQTIRVLNLDWVKRQIPHTLTSRDGLFDTGLIKHNIGYITVPNAPGDYGFFCQIHPFMHGHVIVEG